MQRKIIVILVTALLVVFLRSSSLIWAQDRDPITPDNAEQMRQLAILGQEADEAGIFTVDFSPNGRAIASTDSRGSVCLWDTLTGERLTVLDNNPGWVGSLSFSPDGKLLAVSRQSPDDPIFTVRLWNIITGDQVLFLDQFVDPVNSVAFSPDGAILATGGGELWESGSFQLWDVATGALLVEVEPRSNGVSFSLYVSALAFSPDGTLLATATGDGTVRLWDVATGRQHALLGRYRGWTSSVEFSPDGTFLASGGVRSNCEFNVTPCEEFGEVRLWDVQTHELVMVLEGQVGGVRAVVFSLNGRVLAFAGDWEGTVQLWDTTTQQMLVELANPSVSSLAFSPDGTMLAAGSWDGMVRLWGVPAEA